MAQVNVHEAKNNLSALLKRVQAGEEITIARSGKPVARLVAVAHQPKKSRVPGRWKGRIEINESFFTPISLEDLKDWEGR
jgi:prevent-host-death family protein